MNKATFIWSEIQYTNINIRITVFYFNIYYNLFYPNDGKVSIIL